jgi:hypothetical protein
VTNLINNCGGRNREAYVLANSNKTCKKETGGKSMDDKIAEKILLYLNSMASNLELPYISIDNLRMQIRTGNFSDWDEGSRIAFNKAIRYLIGEGYVYQDPAGYYSITSDGINKAGEIINPPINYTAMAIGQGKKSNDLQILAILIGIISILVAVFGTGTRLFEAKQAGESRAFSGKKYISLSDVYDHKNKKVDTTNLRFYFKELPGDFSYDGIPYTLSDTTSVVETESETSSNPNILIIPAEVKNPLRVHFLINMTYGSTRFTEGEEINGVDICKITLWADKNKKTYSLKAGEDIREWVIGSPDVINSIGDQVKPVWKGTHAQSGLNAVIDHIMLTVPEDWVNDELLYIEIEDRSQELVSSIDPGIIIFGITVEYQNK